MAARASAHALGICPEHVEPAPGETLWLQADAGVVYAFDKASARVNMQLEQIAA